MNNFYNQKVYKAELYLVAVEKNYHGCKIKSGQRPGNKAMEIHHTRGQLECWLLQGP